MYKNILNSLLLVTTVLTSACGNDSSNQNSIEKEVAVSTNAPEVSFKPGATDGRTVKPQGPVTIAYKIIGTPIVGQPIAIDLRIESTLGPQAIELSYRVNDSTAMQFTEAQPATVSIAANNDDRPSLQQVRVIPLREGRLFLNVSVSIETESGSISTVTAIPIQVGQAVREIQQNGEVLTDENGELIRALPAGQLQ
jgi:hypothetical protein